MIKADTFAMTASLAIMTALGPLSTDMYLPSLPAIGMQLAAPAALVQWTLSAFLIGLALGQVVYGPFSDRLGRRPVVFFGFGIFILSTLICAVSTNIPVLIAARFFQAFGASAPIVLARAIVRDLYEGARAARELSKMASIMGFVPAIAPVIGGFIQTFYGWRTSFYLTFAFTCLLMLWLALQLPETIRRRRPEPISFGSILASYRVLWTHLPYRIFVGLLALAYSGLFSFISASSFVLQGVDHFSEILFGLSFGICAFTFVLGSMAATRLVPKFGVQHVLGYGINCLAGAGVAQVLAVAIAPASGVLLVATQLPFMFGIGLTMPQAMAAAMAPFPERAGAASSFAGVIQMGSAAAVGAIVGANLGASAWPLAIATAVLGLSALALFRSTISLRARL